MRQFRANPRRGPEKRGRLQGDDSHVHFAREQVIFDRAGLQGLALDQGRRRSRQINIELAVGRHQFVDSREQEVAGQEGECAPPDRIDRWLAAPQDAMVVDVIVHDAGGVHQFDGRGGRGCMSQVGAA